MFWLPVHAAGNWRLPFTLSATVGLANAWLAATPGERQSRFCAVLIDEPGLALWTLASVAEFRSVAPAGGIVELARWWRECGARSMAAALERAALGQAALPLGAPASGPDRDSLLAGESSGTKPIGNRSVARDAADRWGELAVRAAARLRNLGAVVGFDFTVLATAAAESSSARSFLTDASWWAAWLADAPQWCERTNPTHNDASPGAIAVPGEPPLPDGTGEPLRDAAAEMAEGDCLPAWFWEALPKVSAEPDGLPPLDTAARLRARWRDENSEHVDLAALFAWMAGRTPSEAAYAERLQREKLASLRELAYGASHEINNPLANIATRAQALLRDEHDPERQRSLAVIASQAFRAHDMIADMMFVAKPPTFPLVRTNLEPLLSRLARDWTARAEQQATRLTYQVEAGAGLFACADGQAIAVAIGALLANACEALGSGGQVTLDARRGACPATGDDRFDGNVARAEHSAGITIKVSDDGPGISPQVRRHLFDPYFSGREAGRGLGFGLCKAWRIATDHGGVLTVDGELGRGATFTLWIPASPD